MHDQFVVAPIDKAGVSSNSDTYNTQNVNAHVITNQHSQYLQKNFKLKVVEDNKVCRAYTG